MLKNYLKIAWKVLLKKKLYTFITLSSITLTLTILMILIAIISQINYNLNFSYKNDKLVLLPRVKFSGKRSMSSGPPSFNLISALHQVSGTMAFTFECSHGTVTDTEPEPLLGYDDILDIQLNLYEVMLDYIQENHLH